MNFYRKVLPLTGLLFCTCSFQSYLMVINPHRESRQLLLQLDNRPTGVPIFSARKLAVYALKDNEVDFSSHKPVATTEVATLTLTVPARSALCIAVLRNEHFSSSEQKFINGRVFNLLRLVAGKETVTRANFGAYFRKTEFGAAWYLPQ